MTATEIQLDCRDLEPPEPFERATETLATLAPGTYLLLIVSRRPRLLYPWLREHGFIEVTRERSSDYVAVFICRGDDPIGARAIADRG